MRMATVTAPLAAQIPNFYTEAATTGAINPGNNYAMHDNGGPLMSLAVAGGASLYNNYGDMATWEFYNNTTPTSIFNFGNCNNLSPSLSSFSDSSVYSATDESDLLLMNCSDSDAEFLQQINGCSPAITMHPNLVHTLKNMVAPGLPGGTMYSAQPSVLDRLEQLNRMEQQQQQELPGQIIHDRFLRSALLRQYCQPSVVVPKVELPDLSPPVGAVIPSPVVTEEPLKVNTDSSQFSHTLLSWFSV